MVPIFLAMQGSVGGEGKEDEGSVLWPCKGVFIIYGFGGEGKGVGEIIGEPKKFRVWKQGVINKSLKAVAGGFIKFFSFKHEIYL